tara:strand:- start:16190 stop:16549 length:360 start_codon:yes stop_codon:yes gene_type:complete
MRVVTSQSRSNTLNYQLYALVNTDGNLLCDEDRVTVFRKPEYAKGGFENKMSCFAKSFAPSGQGRKRTVSNVVVVLRRGKNARAKNKHNANIDGALKRRGDGRRAAWRDHRAEVPAFII